MKPIIFDLYSIILQLFDLRSVYNLELDNKNNKSTNAIALRHNLIEQDKVITTTRRVELAYQIANPWKNNKDSKLSLSVVEILLNLNKLLFGFSWKNIDGLDLFSTNKKIIKSNMEDMDLSLMKPMIM